MKQCIRKFAPGTVVRTGQISTKAIELLRWVRRVVTNDGHPVHAAIAEFLGNAEQAPIPPNDTCEADVLIEALDQYVENGECSDVDNDSKLAARLDIARRMLDRLNAERARLAEPVENLAEAATMARETLAAIQIAQKTAKLAGVTE